MKRILLLPLLFIAYFSTAQVNITNLDTLGLNNDQFQKFICIWNADPSYNMTISWVSLNPLDRGTLHYDTEDHGTNKNDYAFSQVPQRTQANNKGSVTRHFARLTDLTPGQKYYFIIAGPGVPFVLDPSTSPRFYFETIPDDNNTRLSIISGGDSRNPFNADINAVINVPGRQVCNETVKKLRPDAVFFGGDYTDFDTPMEWNIWLEDWQNTIADDGRFTPIVAARGNHEFHIEENTTYNTFDTPDETNYYAFGIADDLLRSYTLNSNISNGAGSDQEIWLRGDLAANPCTYWKTAQYHHPTRPHTHGKGNKDSQREGFSKPLEEFGAQFITESDAHLTKSTFAIRTYDGLDNDGRDDDGDGNDADLTCAENPLCDEGFIRDDIRGISYVGEGGWGAELRPGDKTYVWSRGAGSFYQVKWLFIDKNNVEIRTIVADSIKNVAAKTANDDKFAIPAGLALWDNGGTGDVVTLTNPNIPPSVELGEDFKLPNGGGAAVLDAGEHDSYLWSTGETTRTIVIDDVGTYSVTVYNKGKCPATDDITVIEAPLPVELLSFAGRANGAANELTWATATEINSEAFNIESSTDGVNFNVIGKEKASGSSTSRTTYRFIDYTPVAEKTYYRLNQIDQDGTSEYSKTIIVTNYIETALGLTSFSPNPVTNLAKIQFTGTKNQAVTWRIMSISGKVVKSGKTIPTKTQNELNLNLNDLNNGLYFMILEQGKEKVTHRFVKE